MASPANDDSASQRPATQLGTRIPEWVYTTPLGDEQEKSKWDKYRPDILLATEGSPCHGDRLQQFYNRSIHMVEVKYCRDTDRSAQCHKAEQQHEALMEALLQVGYKRLLISTNSCTYTSSHLAPPAPSTTKHIHETLK